MKTKWDLISVDEKESLKTISFGGSCSHCAIFLATEADVAKHFVLPDVRFKNTGYCPNKLVAITSESITRMQEILF